MARMKFLCDAERCIECNGCVTACKNTNEVPWGVNRLEPELGAVDRVAVGEHEVEIEVDLVGLGELPERGHDRTGLLANPRRGRPVVGMRVREQDPLHAVTHRGADDRLHVLRDVGAGIDHRDLAFADDGDAGALEGEGARIARQQTADQRADLNRLLIGSIEFSFEGNRHRQPSPVRRRKLTRGLDRLLYLLVI